MQRVPRREGLIGQHPSVSARRRCARFASPSLRRATMVTLLDQRD
ncbi:hypothetical protein PJI17_20865 [Mycobacterium kansasii]|uniref:Uncharacterized protein n=1 Tax=Mycobacterium kansasii TaxID=1768 RepID=A0A1V3WV02_MYCKA|nr:hypothetical protein I547_6146 [Mycobacterium kansasii 824]KEP39287.1 hypothetical protein MKSMC1_55830 [Mycobacterium kansasii]OOK70760.1 hypothetical protein BZL30_6406 [Mycobacterium kansasii]OOK74740.1 hypothetical protein BZL29_4427 [Mycobacterium kansasii]